jgi:hypothetical protein
MPHPRTGSFTEPGSSLPGFVQPLGDGWTPADDLDDLARNVTARANDVAVRALEGLDGSDPILYPISSRVRPGVKAVLQAHDVKLGAFRASAERRDLNAAAVTRREQALAAERDQALAALETELSERLAAVTAALEGKLAALRGGHVSDADVDEAHAMADRLTRLTPARGIGELVEFFDQVGRQERSREQLVALIPILQSAFETPGTSWAGSRELARLVDMAKSLTDGGWPAAITAGRLERAQRLAGDLSTFMLLAKSGDRSALDVTVTTGWHPDDPREPKEFALFPDRLPPDGPAPEADDDAVYHAPVPPIRRGAISPEQKQRDELTRAAQGDD